METTAKVKHVREEVTKKVRGFSLLCDFLSLPLKCFTFNSTFPLSLSLSLLLSLFLPHTHHSLFFFQLDQYRKQYEEMHIRALTAEVEV